MADLGDTTFAVFVRYTIIGRGKIADAARAAHAHRDQSPLVFDDSNGRAIDLDLRGSVDEVLSRLAPPPSRGRPRLGVTAREITLLPRQWDWLATQPGGASAALRRLVDEARRDDRNIRRQAQETVHRVMTALAGDLPAYEEALRALYAGDAKGFDKLITGWPGGVADYVRGLSRAAFDPVE